MKNQLGKQANGRWNESFHRYRFVVVVLGGAAYGMMKLLRFNVSMAIVSMVNQTEVYLREHPNKTVDDFLDEGYELGGEFDWNYEIQNMIMSWYMIPYTVLQVATTKLAIMMGCRAAIPVFLSLCVLATLLTPASAYWGWQWVVAMRMLDGLGASVVMPLMVNLIETWMPYGDISLGLTVAHFTQTIFSALGPISLGYLISIHWSYAFYGPGLVTLVFAIIWFVLVADNPEKSPFTSSREVELIKSSCKDNSAIDVRCGGKSSEETANREFTFLDVLKVPTFYAYMICMIAHGSTFNAFYFILPTYLAQFLKIGIAENGFYNSVITIGTMVAVLWPHPLWKYLQTECGLSLTVSGRITYAIGSLVVSLTWLYVGAFHNLQLLMLFIGRCFHGCNDIILMGFMLQNYSSVNMSGLAFSVVNSIGQISVAFTSPMIGRYLDSSGQNPTSWFWIFAMLALGQAIIVSIFSTVINSDPIQPKKKKEREEEKPQDITRI